MSLARASGRFGAASAVGLAAVPRGRPFGSFQRWRGFVGSGEAGEKKGPKGFGFEWFLFFFFEDGVSEGGLFGGF